MHYHKHAQTNKGFGLIEIVVGSAIIATVLVGAVFGVNSVVELDRRTSDVIRSNYLLLEGVDVVKIFRDNSWSGNIATLTLDTPYYLQWNSTAWEATTTPNLIDGKFYRTVTLSSVVRDGNDDIATVGTPDSGTRKVTSMVEWVHRSATTTKIFETYVMDLYAN